MTDKTKEPDDGYSQKFFNYHSGVVSLNNPEPAPEPAPEPVEQPTDKRPFILDVEVSTQIANDEPVDAVTKQRMAQMLRKSRGISLAEAEELLSNDKELFNKVYNSRTWH